MSINNNHLLTLELMSPEFYSLYPWNMRPESSFVLSLIVSPA